MAFAGLPFLITLRFTCAPTWSSTGRAPAEAGALTASKARSEWFLGMSDPEEDAVARSHSLTCTLQGSAPPGFAEGR